jgi:hypothetical protein
VYRNILVSGALLASAMMCTNSAQAATIYIGTQIGNGAITNAANNGGSGQASFSGSVGGLTVTSVTGQESGPSPGLVSGTIDVSPAVTPASGSVSLYISEVGDTNLNFNQFLSTFNVSLFNSTAPPGKGTVSSVTEATFAAACVGPCDVTDAFNLGSAGDKLASQNFTSAGSPAGVFSNIPGDVSSTGYVVTLLYTINWQTFTPDDHGNVSASIALSTTPLPGALPLFASGLGAMGLLLRRKKRKAIIEA